MNAVWRKSSLSSNGRCVEVALPGGGSVTSDSEGPILKFTSKEWKTFIDGMRVGEFDSFGNTTRPGLASLARTWPAVVTVRGTLSKPPFTCRLAHKLVIPMQRARCPCRASTMQTLVARSAFAARCQISHLFSTTVETCSSGHEADRGSLPGKNSQMFNLRHVESRDA